MTRSAIPSRGRRRRVALAAGLVVALSSLMPTATTATDDGVSVLLDWNARAVAALSNGLAATPPGAGQSPHAAWVHLAMVSLAAYDAVNSIEGTRAPYLASVPSAPATASKAAAAATAAHHVLVGMTPALPQAVRDSLDVAYANTLAGIPDGQAETDGIAAGAAAASAMLADRVGDARYSGFTFRTGTAVGEWRPVLPAFVNDPFAWVATTRPFSIDSAASYRTEGPLALTSAQYAEELNEVKTLGAKVGSARTPEQTALALFVTANPAVMFNRGLRDLATARSLSIGDAARLFAMTSTSAGDALISCWASKEYWSFWRPITAIRNADVDGNPATVAQSDWEPQFPTPPYPDHPSGYNCVSGAVMYATKAFFGTDRIAFSLTSSASGTTRQYARLTDVVDDTIDGRIYTGFHFRTSDVQAAWIGKKVAQWVARNEFAPAD